MRTAAEYDNFRKRSAREKEGPSTTAFPLPSPSCCRVADALEMAAAAPTEDENFKKGVEMTLTKFSEAFTKLGIEEIEAAGKPFDPELHSAVMQEPASEESPSGNRHQGAAEGLPDRYPDHPARDGRGGGISRKRQFSVQKPFI